MAEILATAGLGLFDLIFGFFNATNIDLDGLQKAYDLMFEILDFVCYFLPMETISSIFSIVIAIYTIRLIISSLTMLWNILPVL